MLAEHPLSVLPCYEPRRERARSGKAAAALGIGALLAPGLLPIEVLHGSPLLWVLWLAVTTAAGALTAWLLVGAHGTGHLAAAFVMSGVVAWLVAPLFGVTGWLLRVPLLRGILVSGGGYL